MTVDFTQLLRKPAGEHKRPPALPAATYPGVVKAWNVNDDNKNKTPYVRFTLGLTGAPDSVDPSELADIDLSKRQPRRDFFLTDDALWRLDAFIASCGVTPNGRSYEEILPELIGAPVLIEMQQKLGEGSETYNQVGSLVGQAGG